MDYYDASSEQQCPACKTTKYRNPQMKLMVNVCGHGICDSCVKLLFVKETGQCPECDMILKRSKFRVQIFEDPMVEKEIDIRRRIMKIFSKQEEDFNNCDDYDQYLEQIEEIVYNLVHDLDKVAMEKKIEIYEKLNKEEIRKWYGRRSKQDEELDRIIEEEKIRGIDRNRNVREEEEKASRTKIKNRSSLLEDLMASEGDASLIVKTHAERVRIEMEKEKERELEMKIESKRSTTSQFSSGIRFGFDQGNRVDISQQEIIPNYEYLAPPLPQSLEPPHINSLDSLGFLEHVRKAPPQSVAGGYTEKYACLRALQEFMWGNVL